MAINISQSIFGSSSATTVFSATLSSTTETTPGQQTASISIEASKREINRIRGYKIQLTPADNQQLLKIQERIQEIEGKAREGTIRPDEVEERSELFLEADQILGKPSADIENDTLLRDLNEEVLELLSPRLNDSDAKRLEKLENYKANLEETLTSGENNRTTEVRLQSVIQQINQIDVPRLVHTLSTSEQREYDELVERVNDHAGVKLLLNAQESKRVYDLEQSINQLQSLLPADASGQPTSQDVARAYSRIS